MDFLRAFAPDRPLIAIFVVLAESRLSHPLAPLPQHTGTVSLGPDFGPLDPTGHGRECAEPVVRMTLMNYGSRPN